MSRDQESADRAWDRLPRRAEQDMTPDAGTGTHGSVSDAGVEGCHTATLLGRHRAGDEQALQELLERYYPRVERIVRVRLGPALLARTSVSDVVQDVFLRVIASLDQYEERDDASWIDWVARLVQREIANQARYFRAHKRSADEVPIHAQDSAAEVPLVANSTGVHSKVSRSELEGLVDECLAELSEAHREVILLRSYAGQAWDRVAAALDRPSTAAAQELFRRARAELAERVQRRV